MQLARSSGIFYEFRKFVSIDTFYVLYFVLLFIVACNQRWAFIAIIHYRLLLSLKTILIHRLPLSLLLYILLSPINYRDKQFLCMQCLHFKISELVLWKKHTVSIKTCGNFKKLAYVFVLFNFTQESVNCSLFLKNLEKTLLQFDLQKKNFVKHIKN